MPTAMLRPVNSAKVAVCAYNFANASSFANASCTFPYTLARRDKKLPGPHTSVKPGKSKKFSTVLFEDCLRLLGGLDYFLRFVALEARKLYNSHDLIPPLPPIDMSRSDCVGSEEIPELGQSRQLGRDSKSSGAGLTPSLASIA